MSRSIVFLVIALTLLGLSPVSAQPQLPKITIPNIPTATQIQARIAELSAADDLDEDARNTAIALYKKAADQVAAATAFSQKTIDFNQKASDAPQRLASIRAELGQPPSDTVISPAPQATLSQIEQEQTQAAAALTAARQLLSDLQAESTHRTELRAQLSERIVKARQELAELQSNSGNTLPEGSAVVVQEAQRVLQRAQALSLQREIEAIDAELASYDARREVLPARRDLAQRRVTEGEKAVAAWQALVTARRQEDAQQTAAEAQRQRRETARQHPVLKSYAAETAERAGARVTAQNASGSDQTYAQRLAAANNQLATVNAQFNSIQKRLAASGLNRATGLILRNHYDSLPDLSQLKREIEATQDALEDTDYRMIELQEERTASGDIDRVAQELVGQIPESAKNGNQTELLQTARELASARRDLLDKLIGDASNRFEQLSELNTTLRVTAAAVKAYKVYIEERILWVRSISADRPPSLDQITSDAAGLIGSSQWAHARAAIDGYVRSHRLRVFTLLTLLISLWIASLGCSRRLRVVGGLVSRYATDSFSHTLSALLLTLVRAAPLACTLLFISWLLRAPEGQAGLAEALGRGLRSAAVFLYPLSLLRQMLRSNGLATAHFRWPRDAVLPIRRSLRWFIPVSVPLVTVVTMIDQLGDETTNASLGRVLFTLEMLALAVFLNGVLRPNGAVLGRVMAQNTGGWVHRFRYVWYLLAILLPPFCIVLSWAGFHYTALRLQANLEQSLILVLVLVIASGIMHRWLFVARRRLAVEDAKRRRAQAVAEQETKPPSGESPVTTAVATVDEEKVDLPALSGQTRQIFRSAIAVSVVIGLYIIWAQALPALRMLDRVQLWPTARIIYDDKAQVSLPLGGAAVHTTPVQEQAQDKNGSSSPQTINTQVPGLLPSQTAQSDQAGADGPLSITLADLGIALIVLIATIVAFRNIPGLLEIIVLQRLPLDAGSRYAMSTVLRYLIAIIGVVIAFQTLGISWTKVQWLAAALTFGLAFGLQEIFANFVSGLIILAERPIRIGDTITVEGVSGTVMRIRMRATTVTDWDRKELVIPNKTFITGDVINWTLSDPSLRVRIKVGVSYSSDIDKVERLLKSIANDNTTVMKDPAPSVVFNGFGDSTLSFELRVYIPHIEFLVPVTHAMHRSIYKAFEKAGIEIAFPQRDLHIRSIGDFAKLIDRPGQPETAPPPPVADGTQDTPKEPTKG